MSEPLVSIIIPLYNSEKYIGQTIRSALDQTWANKEIIIVDDGSRDNSLAIAKGFACENVKVFAQKNKGASAARNKGLTEAKGDYIQFLDADDLLSQNKIAAQIKCLSGSQDNLAVCSTINFKESVDFNYIPGARAWYSVGSDDPVDFLLKLNAGPEVMPGYGGMIQPNAWLTPRNIIEKAGPWNEFRCPDDDGEFFCRVILASKGIIYAMDGLNYYRQYTNSTSLSAQKSKEAFENIYLAIELKYKHIKEHTDNPILDKIFARHYWWTGILAYPQYKQLSKLCTQKAIQLGYSGQPYTGGPSGHLLTKYFGWKVARILSHYKNSGMISRYIKTIKLNTKKTG